MLEKYINATKPYTPKAQEEQRLLEEFTHGKITKTITVPENTCLHYLMVCTDTADVTMTCALQGEKAALHVFAVCLWTQWSDIQLDLQSHLQANHTEAHMHIVSFMGSQGSAAIDGGVHIHENVRQVAWHLLEEIVVIDEKTRIKTLPRLNVASSDVRASHGARIEKLNEKKLFYLMSKGISRHNAKKLMIEGYFNTLFSSFEAVDETLVDLKQSLLHRVIQ